MPTEVSLPRWASLAFAAHCAEHLLPSLAEVWPKCPDKHRETFLAAISAARESASKGKLIANYREIDLAITSVAGALTLHARGLLNDNDFQFPETLEKCVTASHVATVFAKTSETALAKPERAFEFAMDGFSWALNAAATNPELVHEMNDELSRLRFCVAKGKWDHATCVTWTENGWAGKRGLTSWWRFWHRD